MADFFDNAARTLRQREKHRESQRRWIETHQEQAREYGRKHNKEYYQLSKWVLVAISIGG